MDWRAGFLRIWIVGSVCWLFGAAYLAFGIFSKPFPFRGDFQYILQTKEMPWNIDWTKPLYEVIYAPGKGNFPDKFSELSDELAQTWHSLVKKGELVTVEFPDRSRLFLSPALTKDDQTLLARIFWDQRWSRYFDKIWPWLAGAFGPPLGLLIFGLALGWIAGGFNKRRA